ncbi:MAG: RES family NAD+ phosphorylase [bacterium]
MKVYRIARTPYLNDLSGSGARIYGGRWNHKGISMIYTSENRALATVEFLVHLPVSIIPTNLSLATLQIPDEITPKEILISDLPNNWREYPAPSKLAELGTSWAIKNESLLLHIPSAVVEHEFNILINPLHPDMKLISIFQIEPYTLDKRLLR